MATNTENYNLVKPDENDYYDIGIQNDNMDKIDAELKKAENHRADSIAHMTQAQKDTLNSAVQSAIIGDKAVTKNGTQLKIPMPTAADVGAIPVSEKGVPNGVPTLDWDGYVEQLPTFAPAILYGRNWKNEGVFVSDDGDDETGDGTEENPFKTVNKVLKVYPHPNLTITVPPDTTLTISEPVYISNRQLNFFMGHGIHGGTIIIDEYIHMVHSSIAFQDVDVNLKNGEFLPAGICSFNFGSHYETNLLVDDDVETPKTCIYIKNTDLYNDYDFNSFNSDIIFIRLNNCNIKSGINLVVSFAQSASMLPIVFCKIGSSVTIESGAYLCNESNDKTQIEDTNVYILE